MQIRRSILNRALRDLNNESAVLNETFVEESEGMTEDERVDREKEMEANDLTTRILNKVASSGRGLIRFKIEEDL